MVAMYRHPGMKHFCKECGWSIVRPGRIVSDLMNASDLDYFSPPDECPECGSSEVGAKTATFAESLNPLNPISWAAHLAKKFLKKKK